MEKENIHRTGFNTGIGIIAVLLVLTLANGCSNTPDSQTYNSIPKEEFLSMIGIQEGEGIGIDEEYTPWGIDMPGIKSINHYQIRVDDVRSLNQVTYSWGMIIYEFYYQNSSCDYFERHINKYSNIKLKEDPNTFSYMELEELDLQIGDNSSSYIYFSGSTGKDYYTATASFCGCDYAGEISVGSPDKEHTIKLLTDISKKIQGGIKCH